MHVCGSTLLYGSAPSFLLQVWAGRGGGEDALSAPDREVALAGDRAFKEAADTPLSSGSDTSKRAPEADKAQSHANVRSHVRPSMYAVSVLCVLLSKALPSACLKSLWEAVCKRVYRASAEPHVSRVVSCARPQGGHGFHSVLNRPSCGRRWGLLYQESPVSGHEPLPMEVEKEDVWLKKM